MLEIEVKTKDKELDKAKNLIYKLKGLLLIIDEVISELKKTNKELLKNYK